VNLPTYQSLLQRRAVKNGAAEHSGLRASAVVPRIIFFPASLPEIDPCSYNKAVFIYSCLFVLFFLLRIHILYSITVSLSTVRSNLNSAELFSFCEIYETSKRQPLVRFFRFHT